MIRRGETNSSVIERLIDMLFHRENWWIPLTKALRDCGYIDVAANIEKALPKSERDKLNELLRNSMKKRHETSRKAVYECGRTSSASPKFLDDDDLKQKNESGEHSVSEECAKAQGSTSVLKCDAKNSNLTLGYNIVLLQKEREEYIQKSVKSGDKKSQLLDDEIPEKELSLLDQGTSPERDLSDDNTLHQKYPSNEGAFDKDIFKANTESNVKKPEQLSKKIELDSPHHHRVIKKNVATETETTIHPPATDTEGMGSLIDLPDTSPPAAAPVSGRPQHPRPQTVYHNQDPRMVNPHHNQHLPGQPVPVFLPLGSTTSGFLAIPYRQFKLNVAQDPISQQAMTQSQPYLRLLSQTAGHGKKTSPKTYQDSSVVHSPPHPDLRETSTGSLILDSNSLPESIQDRKILAQDFELSFPSEPPSVHENLSKLALQMKLHNKLGNGNKYASHEDEKKFSDEDDEKSDEDEEMMVNQHHNQHMPGQTVPVPNLSLLSQTAEHGKETSPKTYQDSSVVHSPPHPDLRETSTGSLILDSNSLPESIGSFYLPESIPDRKILPQDFETSFPSVPPSVHENLSKTALQMKMHNKQNKTESIPDRKILSRDLETSFPSVPPSVHENLSKTALQIKMHNKQNITSNEDEKNPVVKKVKKKVMIMKEVMRKEMMKHLSHRLMKEIKQMKIARKRVRRIHVKTVKQTQVIG